VVFIEVFKIIKIQVEVFIVKQICIKLLWKGEVLLQINLINNKNIYIKNINTHLVF